MSRGTPGLNKAGVLVFDLDIEIWLRDANGFPSCIGESQWDLYEVDRLITEAEVEVKKGDKNGLIQVERVERYYLTELEAKLDEDSPEIGEMETIWCHPDWDEDSLKWREQTKEDEE